MWKIRIHWWESVNLHWTSVPPLAVVYYWYWTKRQLQSSQTVGSIMCSWSCWGPSKNLDCTARASTNLIEALQVSINSNRAKLKIFNLCLANAGHWQSVWSGVPPPLHIFCTWYFMRDLWHIGATSVCSGQLATVLPACLVCWHYVPRQFICGPSSEELWLPHTLCSSPLIIVLVWCMTEASHQHFKPFISVFQAMNIISCLYPVFTYLLLHY